MNTVTRNHISTFSNEKLEADINHYYVSLSNAGRNLRQTRSSINKKLQALIDEKQNRMLVKSGITNKVGQ